MPARIGQSRDRSLRPAALHLLIAALWASAAAGLGVAVASGPALTQQRVLLTVLLAGAGLLTELFAIRVSEQFEISIGGITIIVAACAVGPIGGAVVGFVQILADVHRPPFMRWLAHAPLRTLVGLAAGGAWVLAGGGLYAASAAAAGATLATDIAGNAAILRLRGADVRAYLQAMLQADSLPFLFYLPMVWLVLIVYRSSGIAALLLIFVPTLLGQYVLWLVVQRSRAYETLTQAHLSFAVGLIRALEASDEYTAGHSAAVGVYARDVALALGYAKREAAVVQLAALLHDVGKIGVPDEVLRKPDRLTESEWQEIQRHPITGERIVSEVPVFRHTADAIRHHHERLDGCGYPDHLRPPDIPRSALIIGTVDAYSAMTQPRAYRRARPPEDAIAELRRCAGTQFDPQIVGAFLRVLDGRSREYLEGRGDEFAIDRQRDDILAGLGRGGAALRRLLPALT